VTAAENPKVVFDCMIYLQGLIKDTGPAVDCIEHFERGAVRLFVSEPILEEIGDVLTRPKLQARYPLLTRNRARVLIEILELKAELVRNVPSRLTYARDPKDEKYLNLAIETNADYLVSHDSDLLDLMTGHSDEAKTFGSGSATYALSRRSSFSHT
jgi:putative PIN family toxin of toxin-antitoxin system